MPNNNQIELSGMDSSSAEKSKKIKRSRNNIISYTPPNLGKIIRLPVPDFNDPDRPPVCLEVDFPIAQINVLSQLEGNAGKPIYQMSKWWARRRSSVFRSLLIAAATEAPKDPTQADNLVWEHYYCNHQKAGSFKELRVLDPFMGGGTTLVEGSRLGFQVTGVDLNPVAWFVTKNELACTNPEKVRDFFNYIEKEVKPLVQPFYTTSCPRGHEGHWIDVETGEIVDVDPLPFPPEERRRYRWDGPEVIYTFWAKHGLCQHAGCGHRTPIFKSPVIAEKKLTAQFIKTTCSSCGHTFNVELCETRMAPGAERIVLNEEPSFTETTQEFAKMLNDYNKGALSEKRERVKRLLALTDQDPGLNCPKCGSFSGQNIKATLESHNKKGRTIADIKKKDLCIESRPVYMYLLVNPSWLSGSSGSEDGKELGGFAGADSRANVNWWKKRLQNLSLVEVRGRINQAEELSVDLNGECAIISDEDKEDNSDRKKYGLPRKIFLRDGTLIQTRKGTVPQKAHFVCGSCGTQQNILDGPKITGHTEPEAAYALQCHCPKCEAEGYNYGGRFFKALDAKDVENLIYVDYEWSTRSESDLECYWPRSAIEYAHETHVRRPLDQYGYSHWWKMFNSRQLLVHSQFIRTMMDAKDEEWPLEVKEQALGCFQQYLRNQNMFVFWNPQRDTPEPMFSNANYHPKQLAVENNVFANLGRGNWKASSYKILEGLIWTQDPWELAVHDPVQESKKSEKAYPKDLVEKKASIICWSSTDLSILGSMPFDLVITDPPFGKNLFYADLADFFYVWLRIPLLNWYNGRPEQKYFQPLRTPHALEAIDNPAEHADDREKWEKSPLIDMEYLEIIRKLTGKTEIKENDPNPLYRPEPAPEFYRQTLTACWAEAARLLKPNGLMAFTFHHSDYGAWANVLESLFDAGFVLIATYPIRSDESKGELSQFGSQKIEYDIIHVCRRRLDDPKSVAWAKMRRWVKEEGQRFKELLESSHGRELSTEDLREILRGKALEFYSRHYGQVYTGRDQLLSVRDALLGINQLLDDLLESERGRIRPPESAEPASNLFLRIFYGKSSMTRDDLHKTLRSTGLSQSDLEEYDWIRVIGTNVHVVPVVERFNKFTMPGRNRRILKKDLDQAHFLVGAAMPRSGINVTDELNRDTIQLKRSVDDILKWYAETDLSEEVRVASKLALELVGHWRARKASASKQVQTSLFDMLEAEDS